MTDSPDQRDPLERLADEFASRCRRGEAPSVAEYAAEYPQYAAQIEELFPTVAMMEQYRAADRAGREATLRQTRLAVPPEHIGDFDIIQEIGRGGMGIVYEAEQRSLGRRVALKVLPKHVLLLDKHLKRFQREAQTAARLRHTNIVGVFGVGEQDGLHYYVMPLVRGVGLDEIIRELRTDADDPAASGRGIHDIVRALIAGKFPAAPDVQPVHRRSGSEHWRTVARVGLQAAEALAYAHAHGTLHRDVKPGNLLVDGEGAVCVADFGLARAVDPADSSRSGEVVGTLRYMAPEQLRGRADQRSDVYALGLTLYELMTLRPALDDTDRRRSPGGRRQVGLEPVRPRKVDPAIPRDLETVVLRCVAHEPSRRYQTAADLAADLRRFLEDRPIHARRASSLERAWRWCRRNPALALMSALAALLLVAFTATALTGYLQTRRAYTGAREALARAEATSQLSLEVLEDIYLQLSPDRVWISSDADPGGNACACIGLRPGAGGASSAGHPLTQVQVSNETAALLEDLLVFYDRLAEQAGDDFQVKLESAIADRRVGDIRQRLGQPDHAEEEYTAAVRKLAALSPRPDADIRVRTELARAHNEIGNVRSAKLEPNRAYESHRRALSVLESAAPADRLPEEHRYELARTYYFLANKHPGAPVDRRGDAAVSGAAPPGLGRYSSGECRKAAIDILDGLAREFPDAPDYRFLLALCHRPSSSGPDPAGSRAGARGRQRAIELLRQLKGEYPQVVDYRYELTVTYAWIHVGLFPWQEPSAFPSQAQRSLLQALDESQWLVDHHPEIPHYAASQSLILAKLGTLCWRTRRFAEADDFFQKALDRQSTVIADFADLPPHNRVVLEFYRLRLAEVRLERSAGKGDVAALGTSRDLLETCTENLSRLIARPELAEDRLAWSALPVAYDVLSRVLEAIGDNQKAEAARQSGETIRGSTPDGRRDPWAQ